MKRNGKNMAMPKNVEGLTSDKWSQMTNTERRDLLNEQKKAEAKMWKDKKAARLAKKSSEK